MSWRACTSLPVIAGWKPELSNHLVTPVFSPMVSLRISRSSHVDNVPSNPLARWIRTSTRTRFRYILRAPVVIEYCQFKIHHRLNRRGAPCVYLFNQRSSERKTFSRTNISHFWHAPTVQKCDRSQKMSKIHMLAL